MPFLILKCRLPTAYLPHRPHIVDLPHGRYPQTRSPFCKICAEFNSSTSYMHSCSQCGMLRDIVHHRLYSLYMLYTFVLFCMSKRCPEIFSKNYKQKWGVLEVSSVPRWLLWNFNLWQGRQFELIVITFFSENVFHRREDRISRLKRGLLRRKTDLWANWTCM